MSRERKQTADPLKAARIRLFGRPIKAAREGAGESQDKMGKRLGYSSGQFISAWECGVAVPPLVAWGQLIKHYGLSRAQVLKALKQYRALRSRLDIEPLAAAL